MRHIKTTVRFIFALNNIIICKRLNAVITDEWKINIEKMFCVYINVLKYNNLLFDSLD